MSQYREASIGVVDSTSGKVILPSDSEWQEYQKWIASGNTPDPQPAASPVSLPERRARRKQVARHKAKQCADTGVRHSNTRFVFSTGDYSLFVLVAVLASNNVPTGFGWRDVDGTFVSLNIAQVRSLVEAYTEREFVRLQKLWGLEVSIDSSEEPETVDLDSGWPT